VTKLTSPRQYADVKDDRITGNAPLGAAARTSAIKIGTVVALAIGASTVAVIESPKSTPFPISAGPIAHVEPWELAQGASDTPIEPRVESSPARISATVASVSSEQAAKPRAVTAEPDLIAAAWAALSDRDPARALELAKRDAHEHPHGVLSEECAAITIVALARLDRLPEAIAASGRFNQEYPNSIHSELVTNALTGETP
jgi:hypothetical protein